ncbi:hypothetical protein [Tautonia plasticadhaerens]|uniref:SWIM-type domain-containing protein n=1 Tax=Tautonia plasticadhaerens TaxID=2527974 RepID=A0A518H5E4_9BACT|nr:hypothetical protein [Tautonia plasticadhaerens]QDV36060.1 hypothetical protein ElP_39700 [Tautonia plasticadhaerens]
MATSTLPARPADAPPPAKGRKFQLYLTIDGFPYGVRPVLSDPYVARRAFELTKPDGTRYDIAQTHHGACCDCPDFIYRREGLDPLGCKHVRALVACGLIEREDRGDPRPSPPSRPPIRARTPF